MSVAHEHAKQTSRYTMGHGAPRSYRASAHLVGLDANVMNTLCEVRPTLQGAAAFVGSVSDELLHTAL